MQRLHIVGAWALHFHDKSFMQHLRIVGVCARNVNKSIQSRQIFCHVQVGCCIRLEQQCLILQWQVFCHVQVGCCWMVSARPSARLPFNSNLSVVPTGRPKALGRPRSLQCNKTVLLLVLLVKLQSYDVWIAGKIIAQT
jgi:hypothetical protein